MLQLRTLGPSRTIDDIVYPPNYYQMPQTGVAPGCPQIEKNIHNCPLVKSKSSFYINFPAEVEEPELDYPSSG